MEEGPAVSPAGRVIIHTFQGVNLTKSVIDAQKKIFFIGVLVHGQKMEAFDAEGTAVTLPESFHLSPLDRRGQGKFLFLGQITEHLAAFHESLVVCTAQVGGQVFNRRQERGIGLGDGGKDKRKADQN